MRTGTLKSLTVMIALLGACSGCGASHGAKASLLQIKGKVTYKAKPLTQGTVTFESQDTPRRATGKLQSDGTFVLSSQREGTGIVAGEYTVTISGVDKTLAQDRAFKKYTNRTTGALTAEVTPDKTEFTFDLK